MERTKICVACFKPIPDDATICPLCQTPQPGPTQAVAQAELRKKVKALRYTYMIGLAALVIFLGFKLWTDHGKKQTPQQACDTAKAYGFAGNMQDCLKTMTEPAAK